MNAVEKKEKFHNQFFVFVSLTGIVTSILLCPFVFNRYLAVTPLLELERSKLMVFCLFILTLSIIIYFLRKKVPIKWAVVFFSCLFLVNIELSARLIVHYTVSFEKRAALGHAANRTYPDFTAYKGHPFLGFTGRPSTELKGNQYLGNLSVFNNFGFIGNDFTIEKPVNTTRIIAMGGSTTISGYPAYTDTFLTSYASDTNRFEVLNFGMTYWTSAHTAVNFILNVVDFKPDYVVFHHAWNEDKARGVPDEIFRNDYSHALTYFHEPEIPDKWPIRASILYRSVKMKLGLQEEWASLGAATSVKDVPRIKPLYNNKKELYPFRRNIQTIIDLANAKGIKVILMTQPHSTDPEIPYYWAYPVIDQGNDIVREIASEYGDKVLLLDLDSMMTGTRNNVFIDIGHMNADGIKFKGEQVGKAILRDRAMKSTN